MENKVLKPKIRFKGFTDTWEQHKFSRLANVRRGLTYSPIDISKNGVRVLRSSNIQEDKFIYSEDDVFVNKNAINIDYVKNNDILITSANGSTRLVGKHALISGLPSSSAVHGGFMLLATANENPEFLNASMSSSWYSKFIELFVSGGNGAIGNLSKSDLDEQEILVPSSEEQKKLGQLFKMIDNLITLHQSKYDKLVNVKKALLEKMFPKDGKNVPEIRFKGFTDTWEQRKVKDICSISTGKSNTQDKIDDGKYPFYVRSEIVEHSNRYLYDEEAVLTVGDGVGTGKVFHYVNGKYDLHQRVYRCYGFSENISAKYFYYYFSKNFYDRVMQMTAKTSVDSVRYEMIADMDFLYPSLEEQIKIVSELTNLDNLITLHQHKLEKLKNMKKSLLNKMFI